MLPAYAPIACDRHDELELLCLHGAVRRVRYGQPGDDGGRACTGRLETIRVAGGEEFLVVATDTGRVEVRLDLVREIGRP